MPGAELAGRVALVTGASSGVGWSLALALAKAGAAVVACARRADRLEALVRTIEEAGGRAVAVALDVEDEASIVAGYDAAESAFGPPDVVIANAGVNKEGRAVEMQVEDLDWLLRVNLRGVYLTAREGARRMMASGSRETGRGRIVLIASIGAHQVLPGAAAYCASKAAVVMLGKSFAKEWARQGINVNTICPGFMRTEIVEGYLASDLGRRHVESFPRKRVMEVEDLQSLTLLLSSDASRAITGGVFTVDDAQSL
jgi:NAD(P)-dependent dehydrogenase (short-subunit alcohol dehydrogenase family)